MPPPIPNDERTVLIKKTTLRNISEALLVLFFLPTAFVAIYKLIHLIASDPPVWVLPTVLGLFIVLVFILVTPKQKWTTITLGLELTGATVILPETPICTVLVIASFPFWFLFIFLVLSLKGVERSEMGYIGTLADVVEVGVFDILKGVKGVVLSIFDGVNGIVLSVLDGVKGIVLSVLDGVKGIALNTLDGLRSVWGIEEASWLNAGVDIEAVNAVSNSGTKVYPPPYQEFTFPDSYVFSKG